MKEHVHHTIVLTVKLFVAACAVLTLLFTLGPKLESWVQPNIYSVDTVSFVSVSPVETRLIITGTKRRACLLVRAISYVDVGGEWIKGTAQLMNADGSIIDPAKQRIPQGSPYVRAVKIEPGGSHVKIYVEAQCHPLWLSTSFLVEADHPDPALVR